MSQKEERRVRPAQISAETKTDINTLGKLIVEIKISLWVLRFERYFFSIPNKEIFSEYLVLRRT